MRNTSRDISFTLIGKASSEKRMHRSFRFLKKRAHTTLIPEMWRACYSLGLHVLHITARDCTLLDMFLIRAHWLQDFISCARHFNHLKCGVNAWSPNLNQDLHAMQCNRMQSKMHDYARGNNHEIHDLIASRSQSSCRANYSGGTRAAH